MFVSFLYWNKPIQAAYSSRHGGSENLVELNDVIFAIHATAINLVYILQVLIYRVCAPRVHRRSTLW